MTKRDELNDPGSCINKAHADEMVFVLLARDAAAPVAIRAWIDERIRIGKNKPGDSLLRDAVRCIKAMEREQESKKAADPIKSEPIWKDRLIFDFDVSDCSPVIKGTWVTAATVVSHVIDGMTWSDILRNHPEIGNDDIRACLAFALEEQKDGQPR